MGKEALNRQNVISNAKVTVVEHRERILGPLLEYDAHREVAGESIAKQRIADFRAGAKWYAEQAAACAPDLSTEMGRLSAQADAAAGIVDRPLGPPDVIIIQELAIGPIVSSFAFCCPKCEGHEAEDVFCPGKIATLPDQIEQPCGMYGPHLHTTCKGCGFTFRRKAADWVEPEPEEEAEPAEPSLIVAP